MGCDTRRASRRIFYKGKCRGDFKEGFHWQTPRIWNFIYFCWSVWVRSFTESDLSDTDNIVPLEIGRNCPRWKMSGRTSRGDMSGYPCRITSLYTWLTETQIDSFWLFTNFSTWPVTDQRMD